MPKELWKIVKAWRENGIRISDEDAESVYKLCLKKMEITKIEDKDSYIKLLFPDELKNFVFRHSINAKTLLMR